MSSTPISAIRHTYSDPLTTFYANPRLPAEVLNVIIPFLRKELPTSNRSFQLTCSDKQKGKLEQAHKLTEALHEIFVLSLVSKNWQTSFIPIKQALIVRISSIISSVQTENWKGVQLLRECVFYGNYQYALKVHSYHDPKALQNSHDTHRGHGFPIPSGIPSIE